MSRDAAHQSALKAIAIACLLSRAIYQQHLSAVVRVLIKYKLLVMHSYPAHTHHQHLRELSMLCEKNT